MSEIVFRGEEAAEGDYAARAMGESISSSLRPRLSKSCASMCAMRCIAISSQERGRL